MSTTTRHSRRLVGVLSASALVAGLLLVGATGSPAVAADAVQVGSLTVDNATDAPVVGIDKPRFGWKLDASRRAVLQTHYRLQVGSTKAGLDSGDADVWDSGDVASDRVSDVAYDGPALASDSRYFWRVKTTTDTDGAAWSEVRHFDTALLKAADKDASWIQEPALSETWTDYAVDTDFQIVAETATLYLRAHGAGSSYMWQVAIKGDNLTFRPHKRVDGGYQLLQEIAIPTSVVPADKLHGKHHLKVTADGSTFTTWINGEKIDTRTDTTHTTGSIGFRATATERARFSNMKVVEIPSDKVLFDEPLDANPFSAGRSGQDGLTVADASPFLVTPGAASWTDYRVDVKFRIVDEAATIYLRSSADGSNSYMWQVNDFQNDGKLTFKPHQRVGGGYTTLDSIPIDSSVVPADQLGRTHTFSVEFEGNHITTSINGTQIDERDVATHAAGTIGMRASSSEKAVFTDLSVTAASGESLVESDLRAKPVFDGGTYVGGGLEVSNADVMLPQGSRTPLVRKDFELDRPQSEIARATLYSTAKGNYGARLNGSWVNDDRLSPGSSDYRDRIYYQTTDVADQLKDGDNTIGAQLSPGWYAGNMAWFGPNQFGSVPAFWAQLQITYKDGTKQTIKTDSSWQIGSGGLQSADILDGEVYDARATKAGWDKPGFDGEGWQPVDAVSAEPNVIVPQIGATIRPLKELKPVARKEVSPGVFVFDFGQGISGVTRIKIDAPAGEQVTLRHAQDVKKDGTLYTANLVAGDNGATAAQTDRYTSDGTGEHTFEPRFTVHGFRYVEVSGYPGVRAEADVTAISVGSELPTTGSLSTGNQMLDQLQSNIGWSLRNNLMSIPTDTNARAERLGWAGDATFSADVATYNYDMEEFYRKWMHDVVYTQNASGLVNNVAPAIPRLTGGGYGGGWGDAIIAIPYASWQRYGDTSLVEENYEAMKKWVLFLESHSNGSYVLGNDMGPAGDWMDAGEGTPGWFTATTFFGRDAKVMAEMAAALGLDEDAARFTQIHESVSKALVDRGTIKADGALDPDTQAAYVMALYADLVPAARREAAADKLVAKIESRDDHVTTGFAATAWVLPVLTDLGRSDVAYRLLQQESYPSWGYMVKSGATTIWERWNYLLPEDGSFHPKLNGSSPDHAVFGSVGNWMYDNIGGIAADPAHPGYREFSIAPQPGGSITQGAGTFDSRYGTIKTDWESTDAGFALSATIPAGSTATVSVPVAEGHEVREGDGPAAEADGVKYVKTEDGRALFRVGSGSYDFVTAEAVPDTTRPTVTTASAPAKVDFGRQIDIRADVASGWDEPATGVITVTEGDTTLSTANLVGGAATVRVDSRLLDLGAHTLTVSYAGDDTNEPSSAQVRIEIVKVRSVITATVPAATYGRSAVLTVTGPEGASGLVYVLAKGKLIGLNLMRDGAAAVTLDKTALPPGKHTLDVAYGGGYGFEPAETTAVLTVSKATSKVARTRISPTKVRVDRTRAKVSVRVTAQGFTVSSGTVRIYLKGKKVGTATIRSGKAVVPLKKFKHRGRQKLVIKYSGSSLAKESTATFTVLVRR